MGTVTWLSNDDGERVDESDGDDDDDDELSRLT